MAAAVPANMHHEWIQRPGNTKGVEATAAAAAAWAAKAFAAFAAARASFSFFDKRKPRSIHSTTVGRKDTSKQEKHKYKNKHAIIKDKTIPKACNLLTPKSHERIKVALIIKIQQMEKILIEDIIFSL